jgi:hypothetical protein
LSLRGPLSLFPRRFYTGGLKNGRSLFDWTKGKGESSLVLGLARILHGTS